MSSRDPNEPIHGGVAYRTHIDPFTFPESSLPADEVYELIHTGLTLDGRETLNLASSVMRPSPRCG